MTHAIFEENVEFFTALTAGAINIGKILSFTSLIVLALSQHHGDVNISINQQILSLRVYCDATRVTIDE